MMAAVEFLAVIRWLSRNGTLARANELDFRARPGATCALTHRLAAWLWSRRL